MTSDPVTALIAYHAALEARDFERIQCMFAENARYGSDGLGQLVGREAIVTMMRNYFIAYPDHHAWDDWVEPAGLHAARAVWHLRATDRATGQEVMRSGIELVTFAHDGLIASVVVTDD